MPTPTKRTDQMTKHLTKAEREKREAAEQTTMKARGKPRRVPAIVKADKTAASYWEHIWKGMEELEILDTVDQYALASLCSLLSMRDKLAEVVPELMIRISEHATDLDADGLMAMADVLGSCNALSLKRLKIEAQCLQLEDKLGLTPSGRSRLAVHKQEAEAADKDDDLFGA